MTSERSASGSTDSMEGGVPSLDELRLSQDFEKSAGVRKKLVTVPVRRPDRQSFIRVHPDPAWRLDTAVLELKEEGETYLVAPDLRAELAGEVVAKTLFTSITKQGVVFLWPVRLPGADGRLDSWNESAADAAQLAMKTWVRLAANRHLGAYEVFEATGAFPEPEWPDVTFQELVGIAFRSRFIRAWDDPVLRKLRGEV
jgi:hypothetical protein